MPDTFTLGNMYLLSSGVCFCSKGAQVRSQCLEYAGHMLYQLAILLICSFERALLKIPSWKYFVFTEQFRMLNCYVKRLHIFILDVTW